VEDADNKWVKAEIKDFGTVVTGKTPSSESPEDFGNEMPFVTPGDFKNYNKFALGSERNLSATGYSKLKSKILPSGAVIVTCIGSDMGKISIAVADCITNQQMNSIVVKETFYSDFLYYYLQSIADEIKGIAMGGSTMPMLSKTEFEKIEIIKPESNILLKFERVMKPMNEMIIAYSKENQKLAELKELLLSKLATIEN
jgi:type I restriction enzyme S subunit